MKCSNLLIEKPPAGKMLFKNCKMKGLSCGNKLTNWISTTGNSMIGSSIKCRREPQLTKREHCKLFRTVVDFKPVIYHNHQELNSRALILVKWSPKKGRAQVHFVQSQMVDQCLNKHFHLIILETSLKTQGKRRFQTERQ
jgi:hypothetical protein